MATAKKTVKRKRKQSDDERMARTALGILVLGLGVLMAVCLVTPSDALVIQWGRTLMRAAGGFLSIFVPLLVCWGGLLLAFSTKRVVDSRRMLSMAALFVLVATFAQVFQIADIRAYISRNSPAMQESYWNFLQVTALRSGAIAVGGGVIGGLLAWPLWCALDTLGSVLLLGVLIVADIVVITGVTFDGAAAVFGSTWQSMREGMTTRREERDALRAEREAQMAQEEEDDLYVTPIPAAGRARSKAEAPVGQAVQAGRKAGTRGAEPPVQYENEADEAPEPPAPPRKGRPPKRAPADAFAQDAPPAGAPFQGGDAFVPGLYMETVRKPDAEPTPGILTMPRAGRAKKKEQVASAGGLYIENIVPAQQGEERVLPMAEGGVLGRRRIPVDRQAAEALAEQDAPAYAHEADEMPWDELPQVDEAWADAQGEEDVPVAPARAEEPEEAPEPAPRRLDETPIILPSVKQTSIPPELEPYRYPPMNLLKVTPVRGPQDTRAQDEAGAAKLLGTLQSFGIQARVLNVTHGPAITRYEIQPAPGVKVSRIVSLVDDIALNMAAAGVRIEAPIPGKAAVGIEIPNDTIATVGLRDVLESDEVQKQPSALACALGKDIAGRRIIVDLAKMPHVLIAGATGSGKSVCINALINSLIYRSTPEQVRMILIDPKVVELSGYNGIPHLLVPVVTDPKKASGALSWAVVEMERRYKDFAARGVRDIRGYNAALAADEPMMPQIVVIIDELADLMMVAPGEVEESICRLAQLARAAGIHLVIATQRPSVNVITGVIKANIPSRIAFAVSSQVDSRTILDSAGAEKLLGKGDMLYAPQGGGKPVRVQGCFVSDEEVARVVDYVKHRHAADYSEDVIEHLESMDGNTSDTGEEAEEVFDELLAQAVEIAVESGQASISMLQRRLRVGYARAGRLIDEMARRGIVAQAEGAKPRAVLITREEYRRLFEME